MPQQMSHRQEIRAEQVKEAWVNAVAQNRHCVRHFSDAFLSDNTYKGFYKPHDNTGWTTGFWTGELWLCYEMTGEKLFLELAEKQVKSFYDRIVNKIDVDHHDMGFLYSLSCVAGWKLTGSKMARQAGLMAADQLTTRFQEKGQFIQAWGEFGKKENYRLIIDCLLNLPLLYWASEETGNSKYADIAKRHTGTALSVLIRPDGSTHHTYFFDPETGMPLYGETAQGYNRDSAWARGQAWGIYGLALAYRYTRNTTYLDLFDKVAGFFLNHLPENMIPYWDLSFTADSGEPWDSSAAAIAVCGMLEMSKYLPEERAHYYTSYAKKMMLALKETCAVTDSKVSDGVLLHGTYAKKSPYNHIDERGVDECNSWGDYFYMEALVRLQKDWQLYW